MTTIPARHRPGPRSWLALIRCEARMVVRDTAGLIVPIVLPLLILVMSAVQTGGNSTAVLGNVVLPLVFALVMASIGIINMPSFLAYYRRTGVLRRLAVTPASPMMVLAAQAAVSLVQALLGVAVAFAVAVLVFDANPPVAVISVIAVVVLSMAAMYAVGLIVASIAPSPNAALAIGLVVFFAVGALGGLFGNREALPEHLATVGELLPFGATVEALAAAWSGTTVEITHLAALGVTTVVGMLVAASLFRWE